MIHHGDCLDILPTLPAESIDAIVTDPPYGLSFMGKNWDHGIPGVAFWSEALRVAKPGTHLLAFGGTRTFHRLTCAIEDAGWEIRDCIMWVYGSGFPKSHNLSGDWQGWGTALKPAWEPIIVARKPLVGTVAENVLAHGAGALNIDGCRVWTDDGANRARPPRTANAILGGGRGTNLTASEHNDAGRWPANLIHDGSDEVVGLFPETTSNTRQPNGGKIYGRNSLNESATCDTTVRGFQDSGSAARFFYCAKASKADRDSGCDSLPLRLHGTWGGDEDDLSEGKKKIHPSRNHHPTVKPNDLMRYLCRLVTPPGGTVLDPFCGSGSTGKAAVMEGFRFIGIERQAEYVEIARARIAAAKPDMPLLVNA